MAEPAGRADDERRFPLLTRVTPPLLAIVLAAFLAMFSRRPYRSFDTYFHLRFGDEFSSGHWGLTAPGQPSSYSTNDWVPTQWLSQLEISRAYALLGDDGLSLLFGLYLVAFAGFLYLLLRVRCGPVVAVVLTSAAVVGSYPWLSLRPQMVSFAFAVIVVGSWDLTRRTGRTPWWLIPLGWIWATSHGMWVLGIAISMVAVLGAALERRPPLRQGLLWASIPLGMLVAASATPVGPRLVPAVLLVNSRAAHFSEWAAPELLTGKAAVATLLLAIAVITMVVRRERPPPYDVALLALASVFVLYSWRTVPLAIVILALLVGGLIQDRLGSSSRPRTFERAVVAASAVLTVLAGPLVGGDIQPGAADEVSQFSSLVRTTQDGAVVLTDRETGSALMWLAPGLDVPVHGYGDVYTDAELDRIDGLLALQPRWDDTVRHLGARDALLRTDDRLSYALQLQGWTVEKRVDDLVWLHAPAHWLTPPGQASAEGTNGPMS